MTTHDFIDTASRFLLPLRMGEGLDLDALSKFKVSLSQLKQLTHEDHFVSIELALVLIDIYPMMLGTQNLYNDDTRDDIEMIAQDLIELVHSVLQPN